MKKLLMIAAIVLFGFTNVNAQDFNFGAKAGVNFASITGDGTDGFEGRTSVHFGVLGEMMFSDKFGIQPELLYSAQGAKYSEFDYKGVTKVDYLNLPVMAKYYVTDGFSLEVGPQVGFLLSAKDDWEDVNSGETGEDDLKDHVKGIDFGVNFGLGYKLDNGMGFGARYNLGLSEINDFSEIDGLVEQKYYGTLAWHHAVFQIYLVYIFMNH